LSASEKVGVRQPKRFTIDEEPEYSNEDIDLDSSKRSLNDKMRDIFNRIDESV
jgi:hypothetical protein